MPTKENAYHLLIREFLKEGAIPLGSGCHRSTFSFGNWVYKVPINVDGIIGNLYEAALSERIGDGELHYRWFAHDFYVKLAKCTIIEISGIPVLKMEKLETISAEIRYNMLDVEFRESLDEVQGGFDIDGTFKIYDYENARRTWVEIDKEETLSRQCVNMAYMYNKGLNYPAGIYSFWFETVGIQRIYG